MEKKITIISETREEISILMPKNEMEEYYNKAYEKAKQDISIPGFRKGKVPLNILKQRFGKEIEDGANEEAINEIFFKISKEDKIDFIGDPSLQNIVVSDDNIEFIIRYDVLPKFELLEYKGIQISEPVHNVSDDEVGEYIEKMLLHGGSFEEVDEITDEYHVAGVKIKEVDKSSGLPIIGSKEEETNIYLAGDVVIPEFKEALIGSKVGFQFQYTPKEQDQYAPDKKYSITLSDAQKLVPAKFDEEFVKKQTNGRLTSPDDLREDIGLMLQDEWTRKSRDLMDKQIIDYLVSTHNFQVPEQLKYQVIAAMVKDFREKYKNPKDQEFFNTPEFINDIAPMAERIVKWEIIRKRIIDKEGIKIEDFDLDPIIESEAHRLKSEPEALRKRLMQNPDLLNSMLAKKIMDFLLDFAVINEVSFEEFENQDQNMFAADSDFLSHATDGDHHHDHDHHHYDHDHDHDHHHHHDHDHKHGHKH